MDQVGYWTRGAEDVASVERRLTLKWVTCVAQTNVIKQQIPLCRGDIMGTACIRTNFNAEGIANNKLPDPENEWVYAPPLEPLLATDEFSK